MMKKHDWHLIIMDGFGINAAEIRQCHPGRRHPQPG